MSQESGSALVFLPGVREIRRVEERLNGLGADIDVAPLFGGCTVFAWSEVLGKADLPGRSDVGALRLRTIATKDHPCADFPLRAEAGYDPQVVLDFDYTILMPRRG